MKNKRVRSNRRCKTKHGWKTGTPGTYNHVRMDGVSVPINEDFQLPSGATGPAPGQTGVAGEDINCRCYLSYDVKQDINKLVEHNSSDDADNVIENDNFVMPVDKITKFMLNSDSKHGADFAEVGYNQDDGVKLYYDIASQFEPSKLKEEKTDAHGVRYSMSMTLGVVKKRIFLTGWIKTPDESKIRFVTAFRRDSK